MFFFFSAAPVDVFFFFAAPADAVRDFAARLRAAPRPQPNRQRQIRQTGVWTPTRSHAGLKRRPFSVTVGGLSAGLFFLFFLFLLAPVDVVARLSAALQLGHYGPG